MIAPDYGMTSSQRQLDREQSTSKFDALIAHDISVEAWREYQYLVGDRFVNYRIKLPVKLYVKHTEDGDSHRVVDAAGVTHYMKSGWLVFRWAGKDGEDAVKSQEA